jgi:hypothetical protein
MIVTKCGFKADSEQADPEELLRQNYKTPPQLVCFREASGDSPYFMLREFEARDRKTLVYRWREKFPALKN